MIVFPVLLKLKITAELPLGFFFPSLWLSSVVSERIQASCAPRKREIIIFFLNIPANVRKTN